MFKQFDQRDQIKELIDSDHDNLTKQVAYWLEQVSQFRKVSDDNEIRVRLL